MSVVSFRYKFVHFNYIRIFFFVGHTVLFVPSSIQENCNVLVTAHDNPSSQTYKAVKDEFTYEHKRFIPVLDSSLKDGSGGSVSQYFYLYCLLSDSRNSLIISKFS